MSIIKRLSTTLFSRIDQVVGEIENHDALIAAAIGEQRKKIAAARVQLGRVQTQERRLGQQLEQLQSDLARWAERAVQCADHDEARALSCMQRRKQCGEQITQLNAARQQYTTTIARMQSDISRADEELRELSQKHALLRARQSSGEALSASGAIGVADLNRLETTLDRWEVRIAQDVMLFEAAEPLDPLDTLEQEYRQEEDQAALRAELQALRNECGEKGHD